ncbi:hypothetical protein SEVIR_9G457350v4 [Setaria viridis]
MATATRPSVPIAGSEDGRARGNAERQARGGDGRGRALSAAVRSRPAVQLLFRSPAGSLAGALGHRCAGAPRQGRRSDVRAAHLSSRADPHSNTHRRAQLFYALVGGVLFVPFVVAVQCE